MFVEFIKKYKIPIGIAVVILVIIIITAVIYTKKSKFSPDLIMNPPGTLLEPSQVKSFPPINQIHGTNPPLADPVVPEEIGLSMVYPQGAGASMSKNDSNSF